MAERPRRQRADDPLMPLVLTLIAGALVTAATGLCVLGELEQLGPTVGNLIVFRPTPSMTEWWRIKAAVAEPGDSVRTTAIGSCDLSPSIMGDGGGSMVIEARRLTSPPTYRVHWAGKRTTRDANDCGRTADLILSRSDLMRLADVAGGFNNNLRMIGP